MIEGHLLEFQHKTCLCGVSHWGCGLIGWTVRSGELEGFCHVKIVEAVMGALLTIF